MSLQFFLYRRLSRWITCEFKLKNTAKIALQNKYEVASFKDVFCHPFYWQVFHWTDEPPKLVVDCGANCGHFSVLSNICFESKFGVSDTQYILVEPNPYLSATIQKNISDAGLADRVKLKQGLLGAKSGFGTIWIDHKNYLTTSLNINEGTKALQVPYLDLSKIVGNETIDILKIDIEGGEFDFVRFNLDVLSQVNLVFMELHQSPESMKADLLKSLQSVGLELATKAVESNNQQLIVFKRSID